LSDELCAVVCFIQQLDLALSGGIIRFTWSKYHSGGIIQNTHPSSIFFVEEPVHMHRAETV
ncbi:MAG: hypothetical protein ACXQTT_07350, partial [Candidatus Syntropharchaeia archaeon]